MLPPNVLKEPPIKLKLVTLVLVTAWCVMSGATELVLIRGGEFASVLPEQLGDNSIMVSDFRLDAAPVTNADFLRFVLRRSEWQKDIAIPLFVGTTYLSHWPSTIRVKESDLKRPVVNVSWFAAQAYCDQAGSRLPTWYEWEYVAAANKTTPDARQSPEWRQQILSWYETSAREDLSNVADHEANYYGVYDMHGLIWEWVDDFNGLLISADNREQGGADKLLFCGAGAITMEQKENYAILMRIAMLSALDGANTTSSVGFRCAQSVEE